ncbi:flavodoxin family protein [Maridesulfovibrio zosterae]|uniref:flavodoxin family protein n=1 Tax=Maridesulfovibrio zosterae TaxID=82171 RepID=UPI000413FF64|nr:flavodoxin family protein [Maridesulfovibrio zosterae]
MKILTLLGSAKKKGNTATVLEAFEDEIKAEGHVVERVNVAYKNVKGCLGCNKCSVTAEEIGCIQKDDAIDILEKMIEADLVVFASPVYFWGVSAQIKAVIDRTYSLITQYGTPNHTSLVKDTPIALLVTGADNYEENAEVFSSFDKFVASMLAEKAGELYIGECRSPADMTAETISKGAEFADMILDHIKG